MKSRKRRKRYGTVSLEVTVFLPILMALLMTAFSVPRDVLAYPALTIWDRQHA